MKVKLSQVPFPAIVVVLSLLASIRLQNLSKKVRIRHNQQFNRFRLQKTQLRTLSTATVLAKSPSCWGLGHLACSNDWIRDLTYCQSSKKTRKREKASATTMKFRKLKMKNLIKIQMKQNLLWQASIVSWMSAKPTEQDNFTQTIDNHRCQRWTSTST